MLGFTPGFTFTVSAASASSRVAFGASDGKEVVISNGTVPIFVALGGSSITALSASATAKAACMLIPASTTITLTREPSTQTHIAFKSSAAASTVYVTTGEGKPL